MTLIEAVRDALAIKAPQTSQETVQELVARQLDELSTGTRIQMTGYFNHSWVPDLIVKWREEADRPVFLRFGVNDASFGEDLKYLSEGRPFFLDLEGEQSDDASEDEFDLSEALRETGRNEVLVSEVGAIDRFKDSVDTDERTKAATRQVVVGGRGLVDPPAAATILESWQQASAAAVEASSKSLRQALDQVEGFLDRIASLDLEADLRQTWVSSGHDAEDFPGSEDWSLADRGPYEIAQLVAGLVDSGGEVTPEQWAEIAQATSATALGHELSRLGRLQQGGMVNDLVRAGLSYWTAKYAFVPPKEADTLTGRFDWSFGKYAFSINLIRREAYFTDTGIKWNRTPRSKALPDARDRLEKLSHPLVLGAGIETPEENVSHELRSTATETLAERLKPFIDEDPTWRSARLQWLELKVPGSDAKAHVDFARNVVGATESIPMRTFVLLVAEFVAALTSDEMDALRDALPGDSGA